MACVTDSCIIAAQVLEKVVRMKDEKLEVRTAEPEEVPALAYPTLHDSMTVHTTNYSLYGEFPKHYSCRLAAVCPTHVVAVQ